MSSTFFLVISAILQAIATALIKLSSSYKASGKKRFFIFGSAMLLYGGGFPLYALGLSGLNISIAQPVFSGTMFLSTALISIFLFKDKLSIPQIAGLVVITASIVTVIN